MNMTRESGLIFDQRKTFSKNWGKWELGYGLFAKFPRIIVASHFSSSSFKLKRGTLPPLTKNYLKTTFHIKPKFFLWIKILEDSRLSKYLISVVATLIFEKFPTELLVITSEKSSETLKSSEMELLKL